MPIRILAVDDHALNQVTGCVIVSVKRESFSRFGSPSSTRNYNPSVNNEARFLSRS
jgi:hypothetical protein